MRCKDRHRLFRHFTVERRGSCDPPTHKPKVVPSVPASAGDDYDRTLDKRCVRILPSWKRVIVDEGPVNALCILDIEERNLSSGRCGKSIRDLLSSELLRQDQVGRCKETCGEEEGRDDAHGEVVRW
jgi:hypothetical protein